MTSIPLSSARALVLFRSHNNTFVLTAAPASRHMGAMARSIPTPLVRKAPERGQGPSRRLHLHLAGTWGKGKRFRRNNRTRKRADSMAKPGVVGSIVYGVAAKGR